MLAALFILLNTFIQNTEYSLEFSKVDNRVNVFVGDSLIFDSETIDNSPGLKFNVNLSAYMEESNKIVKVVLYNGHPPYTIHQVDPIWELRFELFRGKEELDFFYEYGDNNALGKVVELEIDLNNY